MRDVISICRNLLRVFSLLTFVWAAFASLAVAQNVAAAAGQGARLEGTVCTATGEPIGGALVQLRDSQVGPGLEVRTDAGGKYALTVTKAGRYELRASRNGFAAAAVQSVELANGDTKHLDMVLTKESATDRMRFSDEPNFTVAGVTDWSNVGLHGSDANVRTSESLAKETASLKPGAAAPKSAAVSAADSHRLLGDAHEKGGDPLAAVNEYEKAVKLDPSEGNYFAWGSELLLHRGGIAAVEVFHKGALQHPKSERMRAGLGAAYYANGQFAEAAANMCEASDLNPEDAQPYLFLGRMEMASTGELGCSNEKLQRFVTLQPQNPLANDYYGFLLWKQGRQIAHGDEFGRAEAYFKKALALDPTHGEVYVHLGMLYNARGEKDAALRTFEQGVAASPQSSAGHYHLSLAYRRVGQTEKAEQQMKLYRELKRSEDAQLEKERREMRQFVTTSKEK